ncbi:MAG TPA: ComEC/Rec2 family competence protein [Candidatus Paceibacterota bacterium]
MVEIAILFLTFGAALFHVFGVSFLQLALISIFFGACTWLYVSSKKGMVAGSAVVIFCIIGGLLVWSRQTVLQLELFGERRVEATVLSVNRELDRTNLTVRDEAYSQRIQVTVYEALSVVPGDIVSITGIVEQPQDFITDTGRLFAYKDYLESKGIVAVMYDSEIALVHVGALSARRVAATARYVLSDIFVRHISFPVDGIVSGMVLGYQGGIPKDTEDLFRTTGVLHVLVLSGYNITLLGGFIGVMFRSVPTRVRLVLTFFGIIFLVLISGAGVAAVRAGVMGSIALLATMGLQEYNALRALFISYIVFFFWSPLMVFYDPGFHLSFLATLCMVTVIPKAEMLFSFIPKTAIVNIRELVMLAVLLPLFMLPYLMYFAGIAPLASVPANIFLGVATPVIMIGGAVVLISSFIAPVAAALGALLSFVGTVVIEGLQLFSLLPLYNTPDLSAWSVVGIYCLFFLTLFKGELSEFISRVRKNLLPQTSSYSQ